MEIHPGHYVGNDAAMIDALNKLYQNGFSKYDVVTSGREPDPKVTQRIGLSRNSYKDGRFKRFHYVDVSFEDVKYLVQKPKVIRYVIAEKKWKFLLYFPFAFLFLIGRKNS